MKNILTSLLVLTLCGSLSIAGFSHDSSGRINLSRSSNSALEKKQSPDSSSIPLPTPIAEPVTPPASAPAAAPTNSPTKKQGHTKKKSASKKKSKNSKKAISPTNKTKHSKKKKAA
ncbi:MAG: protein tyrosine phosphatase [Verrucomicrobiota bacterium]